MNYNIKTSDIIGAIVLFLIWTAMMLFLGMIIEWDKYGRVQRYEIQTKIVEYRLGNMTLGRDTMNVVSEKYK